MAEAVAAWVAAIGLTGVICFQALLVLGFPFGQASWGGKYTRLPAGLRIASVISICILSFMMVIVLEARSVISILASSQIILYGLWVMAAFFALNTFGNFMSRSKLEKRIMTPVSLVLFLACLTLAIIFLVR